MKSRRRGSALLMTVLLTAVLGAVAIGAIYASGNASMLNWSFDREREFKYAAEAGVAMGKSRLNNDPLSLPDTGYVTLIAGEQIVGADGVPLRGLTVSVYAGPTGSSSGQFGRFASVVADVHDGRGARFVRRVELAQENFARYAYWSNRETSGGGTIYFGGGDNLWGPVWSNDVISIHSTGASFHSEVGTARTIDGVGYGTFAQGYAIDQRPIVLPSNTVLSRLAGYAASGDLAFNAPTSGDETSVRMRVEFVAVDLNGDGDSTDVDEGFLKVYTGVLGYANWVRGDWNGTTLNANNCGAAYPVTPGGARKFFPISVHNTAWVRALLQAGGMSATRAADTSAAPMRTIMQKSTARCYLGGDPHLVAVERNGAGFPAGDREKGGDDTTFTPSGVRGSWAAWPGAVDARLSSSSRAAEARYLFPIYRGLNPGTKGVLSVVGTVGVSGVLRGRITIYATGTITLLDDMRYASDPAAGRCVDILGLIADRNIAVAYNAVLSPPDVDSGPANLYRNTDDSKDVYLHAVLMALGTSFHAQSHSLGPTNTNGCEASQSGRGCLYLTGGVIQDSRGAVGTTAGAGYIKRYSYDRCALANPPPYFPTTGRFTDNRYYEIDPARFNVAELYRSLVPGN